VLPGETNDVLLRPNFQMTDEGLYEVTVTNGLGSLTSSARLFGALPLGVVLQPLSREVAPGERFTLSLSITGHPPPFSYEWRRPTTPFATNVSDLSQDFITLTAPAFPTQVLYRVVVRNPAFPLGAASTLVAINVLADADGDGLPDAWEAAQGFPTNNPANGLLDTDGDGLTDAEEYVAGTQPTNAASTLRMQAAREGGGASVGFAAVSNRTYAVQGSPRLGAGWSVLTNLPSRPTNGLLRLTVPPAGTNFLFRVVTPAQP